MKSLFILFASFLLCYNMGAQTISTVAGGGTADPGDGGQANDCKLNTPTGITIDAAGNYYFCERDEHRVRKVAPDGTITTFAGTGIAGYEGDGGQATDAKLNYPYCMAVDAAGNVFVGDASPTVRKISTAGIISTVAGNGMAGYSGDGGPATLAKLDGPSAIAVDGSGNLYLADKNNNCIRKINPAGMISTIAGTGTAGFTGDGMPATEATLHRPAGVAVDGSGNIFIADAQNHRIRKVSASGIISTIAGSTGGYSGDGGPATDAKLNEPFSVVVDNAGNILFGDTFNYRVRRISSIGIITTLAGDGGSGYNGDGSPATAYRVRNPIGLSIKSDGSVLVCDFGNDRIRRISDIVAVPNVSAEAALNALSIYPNPSSGRFLLNFSGTQNVQHVSVSDVAGRMVREVRNMGEEPFTIDITGVSPGLYIVTAHTASGNVCGKVTII